jgi:hypothetical protein
MLLRTTIALAVVLASASGAMAAQNFAAQKRHDINPAYQASASATLAAQKKHSGNSAYDVYDVRGQYLGSDPDAAVRAQIARDPTASD